MANFQNIRGKSGTIISIRGKNKKKAEKRLKKLNKILKLNDLPQY